MFVTGTFDDWKKTIKLHRESGTFQREIDLPSTKSNIYYKFVVDGKWTLDLSAPSENDPSGIPNNVLIPSEIQPKPAATPHDHHPASNPASAVMSGIGPGASTTVMAGKVPLEKNIGAAAEDEEMPGAFPAETPQKEAQDFAVKPIPASAGTHNPVNPAPGDKIPHHSTYTSATIDSGVHDDPALKDGERSVGISPLPATSGAGNPISAKPGEKLPASDSYTSNTIQSNVRTDKASYEKSDAYPSTSDARQDVTSSGAFGVPPVASNMIPESSLPMGSNSTKAEKDAGPIIQSAGANTSTAAMAGEVPKEARGVPGVVRESQLDAHQPPEASSSRDAVADKRNVEQELKQKVPEQPSTSENSTTKSAAAATAAGATGLAGGAAVAAVDVPQSIQKAISDMNSSSNSKQAEAAPGDTAPGVPEQVSSAQVASSTSPEASASPQSVANKKAVEAELESKMAKSEGTGVPAAPYSAEVYQMPRGATQGQDTLHQNDPTIADENTLPAISVANANPEEQHKRGSQTGPVSASEPISGGATTSAAAFKDDPVAAPGGSGALPDPPAPSGAAAFKDDPISPTQKFSHLAPPGKGALNAAATTPAKTPATKAKAAKETPQTSDKKVAVDDREVSPMTKPGQPSVTTGTEKGDTPLKSGTSASAGADDTVATDKKNKRRSIFGKIKDKLKH